VNVEDSSTAEPDVFTLHQNVPNPFNAATAIRYELFQSGDVSLVVCDSLGREVAPLAEGYRTAGVHTVTGISDSRCSHRHLGRP